VLSGLAIVLISPSAPANAQAPPANVEIMLAVDTSGSMRVAMEAAKTAANEFVASMPVNIPIGVEAFGDSVTVLTSPTLDRALLVEQINGIVANGNTALYDAVVTASQQFTPGIENRVLVVLSDGKDEGSSATLDDAIAAVQGLHVEAISLTTPETDINGLSALGPVTSADDAAGMSAAFARVASLLAAAVVELAPVNSTATPATTPVTTIASPTAPAATTPATTSAGVTATSVASSPSAPVAAFPLPEPSISPFRLWLGGLGVFLGLFILVVLLFPRNQVSKARLGINKPRTVSDMGRRTISAVEEALERHGKRSELATTLAVANITMQPGEFIGIVAVVALIAGLVGFLFGGLLAALLVATVVCLGVRIYVGHSKSKRQAAFADQLPDVIQLVTTALRSGYGLTQALDSVADEAEEPARSEFAHVLVETRLGRDLSEAMRALAHRMESEDLDWVVAAIDINRDTGGNLSEILNTVSATIRERQRMHRQVRTLTAEGRLSARILTVLPLVMAFWQWRVNRKAFSLLTHGGGLVALVIAGILMIVGAVWTRKIVNSLAL
jgi:tight adherence protein B